MKAEVFEQRGWKELEPVRQSVPAERRVVSPEKQQPDTIMQEPLYWAKRLTQVREDINNIGRITPYSLDWLNPPRVVMVREQEEKPKSLWQLLSEISADWLAYLKENPEGK